ncbi:MAG: DUF1697 domain-containing protein [Verrucomicrobiota bacterium]|nr:DUF1697 domain-containing protein [Verrucomicrobiota bacterium]
MARYFAFLRAINVGGRTVRMERLRDEFTALGFSAVETFIASGNVIFESRATKEKPLREKIERHLKKTLGFEVATFLRTTAVLTQVSSYRPFPPAAEKESGHSILVAFLSTAPDAKATKNLIAWRSETDDFHLRDREVYWLCRTRMSDSKFSGARLEKIVGQPVTFRNLTTIKKLAAKYPPPARA